MSEFIPAATSRKKEKEKRKSVLKIASGSSCTRLFNSVNASQVRLGEGWRGLVFRRAGIDFAWKMAESLKALVDRRRDKGELRKEKRARETAKQKPGLRKSRGTRICGYRLTSSRAALHSPQIPKISQQDAHVRA